MDPMGSEKNFYRDPLIAMAFFAIVFFLVLLVILILWCKGRRQTEVKTVVIEPKRRPVSTRPVKQINGGNSHGNGDVEAGAITANEIELSDDQEEAHTEKQTEVEEPHHISDNSLDNQEKDVTAVDADTEKGEINPTFQTDDNDNTES